MNSDFLGKGLNFPLQTDDNGQVAMAYYEESVRQSILMILNTAPGERLMRPEFGCGLHELVFDTNSASTSGRVAGEVRRALTLWEPRIDTLDVSATTDQTQPNLLQIEINYLVRNTNNRFNLVYPFYLE